MQAGEARGGGGQRKKGDLTRAARHRSEGEDFSTSFEQLQAAVRVACVDRGRWEEQIAAGVRAALDFMSAQPRAACAVTIDVRRKGKVSPGRDPEREVIIYFSDLLGGVAPGERRSAISTDEAIVRSIATISRGYLLAGNSEQLPSLAPDLIYLALMPYTGIDDARRWADSSGL